MIHFFFCPFSPITSLSFSFYSISWNFLAFHFLLLRLNPCLSCFTPTYLDCVLKNSNFEILPTWSEKSNVAARCVQWNALISTSVTTEQTSDPDWESSLFTKSGWAINDYSTLVLIAPPLRLVLMLLQLRKWPLSSVQTQHSFEVRDTLCAMCNNWAQFRSIECRCVGALLGQFKASSEFDPFGRVRF